VFFLLYNRKFKESDQKSLIICVQETQFERQNESNPAIPLSVNLTTTNKKLLLDWQELIVENEGVNHFRHSFNGPVWLYFTG